MKHSLSLGSNCCCLSETLSQPPLPQARLVPRGSTDPKGSLVLNKGHSGSLLIAGSSLQAALETEAQGTAWLVEERASLGFGFRAP